MDKQVMKMSCVLHVAEKWKGKDQPITIEADTVKWAIKMYKELIKLYIDAADSNGFIGEVSEIKAIKEQFIKFLQKDKNCVTYSELKDYIKNRAVFKGRARLASYIKDKLLMRLLELKFCTLVDDKMIINPRLK
jgi:soluble P-type ATPase